MESISSHIKSVSQSMKTPIYLRSRILNAVTNDATSRTISSTPEGNYQASPFIKLLRTRAFVFASTVCLIFVIGIYSYSSINSIEYANPSDKFVDSIVLDEDVHYNEIENIETLRNEIDSAYKLITFGEQSASSTSITTTV